MLDKTKNKLVYKWFPVKKCLSPTIQKGRSIITQTYGYSTSLSFYELFSK